MSEHLFYFILGIIFWDLILPLLEAFATTIVTRLEVYKAHITKGTLEETNQTQTNVIGFDCSGEATEEEIIDD